MIPRTGIALLFVVVAVIGLQPLYPTVTLAQTGVAGTWRVDVPAPGTGWAAMLRVESSGLTGAVSSCSSGPGAYDIFDSRVDGNAVTFKCTSGDEQRTVTFRGVISADEIALTWDIQVRPGGAPRPGDLMFGTAAPQRFIAKRVSAPGAQANARALREATDLTRTAPAVTFERIVNAAQEPHNWLTYSGDLHGSRHSALTHITPANVNGLELAWLAQAPTNSRNQATPLVVDGVMYTTRNTNDVVALDAATGTVLWVRPYTPMPGARATGGGGRPNRGLAILGRTLFLATLDAHLLAIDALSGTLLWNTTVADARDPLCEGGSCYVMTLAPLIVKNKVVVGVGGGEGKTRGFVAAFDAATGKEAWRFHTIPGTGEPGNLTWTADSWKTGGSPVWNTGAFDPNLNLTYWGTGNPSPPRDDGTRDGDNLYSNCVVALDAGTGKLKWHYQFTPHDVQDWDSTQVPILVDLQWQGRPRKVMLWANRNGLFYVLDRATGEFLMGKPFVAVNWMNGFDVKGRPNRISIPSQESVQPSSATNWNPHSYSPRTGLFYVGGWERGSRSLPRSKSYSALRAIDPLTGDRKWEFRVDDGVFWTGSGVLTTASDLLFTGSNGDTFSDPADARRVDGYLYALDARTGQLLRKVGLSPPIQSPPMTYAVGGTQYIAVTANDTLFAFSLRQ